MRDLHKLWSEPQVGSAVVPGDNVGMGTYVITGATGAIGFEVAGLLHRHGHGLVLFGRSAERLDDTAARLVATQDRDGNPAAEAPPIRTVVVDLAEPHGIADTLTGTELPPLDGVVHSAGTVELGRVAELRTEDWTEQMTMHVVAPAAVTRALLPRLRVASGHVVFVNSGAGLRANPGWSAYAAGKHALKALADALRAEEPELRVTSVYPGRTAGDMQRKVRAQESAEYRPEAYIAPRTVASVVVNALLSAPDADITDVSVRGRS